jgi:hypothetical protein
MTFPDTELNAILCIKPGVFMPQIDAKTPLRID